MEWIQYSHNLGSRIETNAMAECAQPQHAINYNPAWLTIYRFLAIPSLALHKNEKIKPTDKIVY